MNQKVKMILGLLAFAIVIVGAVFAYNLLSDMADEPENLAQEPQNGDRVAAPDFVMYDQDGNELTFSDFFGAPIVLNFWASWCPACVVESPYFEALYQEMGDEIHVLKVNLLDGQRETRARVDQFMEEHGYSFPLYFDMTGAGANAYGVHGIPQTMFIDAEGYIVAMIHGAAGEESLREGIELARGNVRD